MIDQGLPTLFKFQRLTGNGIFHPPISLDTSIIASNSCNQRKNGIGVSIRHLLFNLFTKYMIKYQYVVIML